MTDPTPIGDLSRPQNEPIGLRLSRQFKPRVTTPRELLDKMIAMCPENAKAIKKAFVDGWKISNKEGA